MIRRRSALPLATDEASRFLPWLTATAFLHSVIVQERRNMLRIWNVSLCALTYILTVFGTFLTRSGIVQSVHAFAEGNVGQWLLTYIVFITLLTIVTIAYRYRELRSPESLESYFSREAAFLFNNLVLLGICFATFWGVMFPVFSEALGYEKSVVGPPFFNQVNGPLFLVLIALMGYGPLISWKRNSWQNFAKLVWRPLLAGSAVTVLFLGIDGTRIIAAVSFGLFVFVLGTIMGEFHRAARIRRELSQGEGALPWVWERGFAQRRASSRCLHKVGPVGPVGTGAFSAGDPRRDVADGAFERVGG
mgnify:CR=1 FL=1